MRMAAPLHFSADVELRPMRPTYADTLKRRRSRLMGPWWSDNYEVMGWGLTVIPAQAAFQKVPKVDAGFRRYDGH